VGLLHPAIRNRGFHIIVEPTEGELRLLGLGILSLAEKEVWETKLEGLEAALVILGGKCEIRVGGRHWPEVGERANVFCGRASALFVPPSNQLEVKARGELEAVLITAPARAKGEAILVRPESVAVRSVGLGNWRRSVQDIIDKRIPAQRLLVGETYNEPGAWSSYPPHKHDIDLPGEESCLEEVYHFRVNPPEGFGMQRIYSPETGLEEIYVVRNGDTVVIPRGYHPVVAAPGYSLYYLWALAGEKREMRPREDPAHSWIHQLEAWGKKVQPQIPGEKG